VRERKIFPEERVGFLAAIEKADHSEKIYGEFLRKQILVARI
jgi:hypothetical protein